MTVLTEPTDAQQRAAQFISLLSGLKTHLDIQDNTVRIQGERIKMLDKELAELNALTIQQVKRIQDLEIINSKKDDYIVLVNQLLTDNNIELPEFDWEMQSEQSSQSL